MRKAGYPYDPATNTGGYPHVIPYLVYKQGLQEYMGQVLAQQLERVGLRLEIRVVNYPTFMALRGRRKGSAFGPGFWIQDYPDALAFLEPMFTTKAISEEDSNNWSFLFESPLRRSRRQSPQESSIPRAAKGSCTTRRESSSTTRRGHSPRRSASTRSASRICAITTRTRCGCTISAKRGSTAPPGPVGAKGRLLAECARLDPRCTPMTAATSGGGSCGRSSSCGRRCRSRFC